MNKKLIELNAAAYEYQLAVEDKIIPIFEPLRNLDIPNFSHHRVFYDGSYSLITDNSNYAKVYLSSVDTVGTAFTEQINKSKEGRAHYFFIPNDIKLYDEKTDHIMHVVYNANFWNVLCIFKLNNLEYIDAYSFGIPISSSESVSQFYLNNMPLLERFINYYNTKAEGLITKRDKKSLSRYLQTFNFRQNDLNYETEERVKQFLQSTQYMPRHIQYNGNNITLSPRQIECLKYLSEGYSMKRIAAILNLSQRTVEFYLNSIKTKADCTSTKALISSYIKSVLSCKM